MAITIPALNLLFIIGLVGGVVAVIDAIVRIRARSTVLGIIQLIAAGLFTLSLFVANVPFGQVALAVVTIILLVLGLAFRGSSRRGGVALTIVALILLLIYLILGQRIVIPGINA
jgi:hypothetical protein